ncbi:hypothetical protein GCM10010112_14660 [Actinoplanes lobatus]|uniref:Uncharacterized protein n=1 Tax=Actinoplanes lobatus TaxID=113568 RepID=A0A7W7HMK9_9ACTN|nr:hypothetical protein [Actinoplanes lobatus]MBB4753298.1 hypothetical protein [Actinoplanes lobatus]GGN59534.1 hypothetical protein GCM10010112_14660 [Actinoplanes lobatus]GIE37832.1 hypothetical protein Alo02nite_07300 [Actinoplanes lobatus]
MRTVNITVESNGGQGLRHLSDWLLRAPAIRMHGNVRTIMAPPQPERMTVGVADYIEMALGAGLSMAQIIVTIIGWRRSQPPHQRLSVTVTNGEKTIVIDTDDPGIAEDIARQLGS